MGKWGYRRIFTKLNSEMFKLTENKFQGIAVSQYGNASELIWSELDEKGQAFLIKYEVYSRLKFILAVLKFFATLKSYVFCRPDLLDNVLRSNGPWTHDL